MIGHDDRQVDVELTHTTHPNLLINDETPPLLGKASWTNEGLGGGGGGFLDNNAVLTFLTSALRGAATCVGDGGELGPWVGFKSGLPEIDGVGELPLELRGGGGGGGRFAGICKSDEEEAGRSCRGLSCLL